MNITRNPRPRPRSASPSLDPRQAILAQWRGVDLAPVEKAKALTAQAIKAVMPKVLSELGLERRCGETEILKVWNHLLDPNIVTHAQPAGLHKGTLFVNVDNSVWLNELVRYRRREILERLQHSFGKALITRISFRIG
jgi:predicted nucleic acid-binding Zn ribbon protein